MNRFYRKPKPETMKKNRETNMELYSEEMNWCKEHMANYKVPREVVFVNQLPLNASGKVMKYKLRKDG